MAKTVTLVFNVNDAALHAPATIVTATSGQSQALAKVGRLAAKAIRQTLGPDTEASAVTVTSVTVA